MPSPAASAIPQKTVFDEVKYVAAQVAIQSRSESWIVRRAPSRSWIQPKKKAPPAAESWTTRNSRMSSPEVKPTVR